MNFEVVSEPIVEFDLIEILKYYDSINPKLGDRFILQFQKIEKTISISPFGFEIKYKKIRTIQLYKFPYLVHYFINEVEKKAIIIAITHSYKNPEDYTLR